MRTRSVHGSWLANDYDDRTFVLWAETSEPRADVRMPQHPFALSVHDLRHVLKESAPSINDLLKRGVQETTIWLRLPSTHKAPQSSLSILRDAEPTTQEKVTLADWRVVALAFVPSDSLDLLASFPNVSTDSGMRRTTWKISRSRLKHLPWMPYRSSGWVRLGSGGIAKWISSLWLRARTKD